MAGLLCHPRLSDTKYGSTLSFLRFPVDGIYPVGHYRRMTDGKPERKTLLNQLETAAQIGCDPKTLRKWLKEGVCPVAPLPGIKPPLWHRADVEAFVTRRAAV